MKIQSDDQRAAAAKVTRVTIRASNPNRLLIHGGDDDDDDNLLVVTELTTTTVATVAREWPVEVRVYG